MGTESSERTRNFSQEDYIKHFGVDKCIRCGSRKVVIFERTKETMTYVIYICHKCRGVLGREFKECR